MLLKSHVVGILGIVGIPCPTELSKKRSGVGLLTLFVILGMLPTSADAATFALTYHHKHLLYTIPILKQKDWMSPQEVWMYNGKEVTPPQELRADGDEAPAIPSGFQKQKKSAYNRNAIMATLQTSIANDFNHAAGKVTIGKTATGAIVFDGVGFPGRTINLETAADLTIAALNDGVGDIMLPVIETAPTITVTDPDLQKQGIKELVTIGESDFSNSPKNRLHNIAVGLGKFNGHLIPKDSVFSFTGVLGPVDGSTGYLKELVIKGDQTVPDYGGGLCQVSSTAYRGVWEYGFPITDRRNHSYMVSHYLPQGTDATVYPGSADMKFKNDSPGALLMQTYAENNKAYFLYYGTKDGRKAEVLGPFIWAQTPAPPEKTQLTLDLKPGERKKVGERVPGARVAWFRTIDQDSKTTTQGTYSIYSARPLFYLVGTDKLPVTGSGGTVPEVFLDE